MNLWWDDYLHASKYGSYLDALVQFGTITGLDPLSLGAGEEAATDLGISTADALTLQRIASQELAIAAVPEPSTWALLVGGLLLVGRVATDAERQSRRRVVGHRLAGLVRRLRCKRWRRGRTGRRRRR